MNTSTIFNRTSRKPGALVKAGAALALVGGLLAACAPSTPPAEAAPQDTTQSAPQDSTPEADHETGHDDPHAHAVDQSKEAALYGVMRELWADHMQWTYATVKDFFHNQDALGATLERLLENQVHLGDAIAGFYGEEAGQALTELLTEHIEMAVPVLTAARDDDEAGLEAGLDDWYGNAQEIADFLTAANPDAWPAEATSEMMKGHIDTTVVYAVELLKGDYAQSIIEYDVAFSHMMGMSDALAEGIINQFPDKF